jgi:hypothetical protein
MGTFFGRTTREWAYTVFRRKLGALDALNRNVDFIESTRDEFGSAPVFATRTQLYSHVFESELRGNAIDYLEFGVWRGESIRHWASAASGSNCRFFGFDTFTGLPEDWEKGQLKGTFNTEGAMPNIEDTRVRFVKGLFQKTLYPFLEHFVRGERLVVHVDCDLYSSTLFCLSALDRYLRAGDVIILDDFYSLEHEFAAFADYRRSFYRTLAPLASTPHCTVVAFKLAEDPPHRDA